MFQDQLEAALGADAVIEGDLDDRTQLFVILRRPVVANGARDRLGLGDGPIVGPGSRDIAGIEIPASRPAGSPRRIVLRIACVPVREGRRAGPTRSSGKPSSCRALSKSASSKARYSTRRIQVLDQSIDRGRGPRCARASSIERNVVDIAGSRAGAAIAA